MELQDVGLYQELKRRSKSKRGLVDELVGALATAARSVTPLLEYVRLSCPTYTDHSVQHSLRILVRIEQILSKTALGKLGNYEIFCLIIAALFHDTGMIEPRPTGTQSEASVDRHHIISGDIVSEFLKKYLPGLHHQRLSAIIQFVIKAHGLDWDEMLSDPLFRCNETIGSECVRPRVLAILLRIGDLLDLDEDRTSLLCLRFYADLVSQAKSLDHHLRHLGVPHFYVSNSRIEISARCQNREQYRIWSHWLHYIERDIEKANTYIFRDDLLEFQLPTPVLEATPTVNATFMLWNLRFEIDDDGKLWDVLRKSVYTGRHDHVREIVSNGIDACVKYIYEKYPDAISSPSPRAWKVQGYHPLVAVVYEHEKRRLTIADNGVGMSKEDLESFLFRIASRGRAANEDKLPFPAPTIGHFGVGFISILSRAAQAVICTRRHSANDSYQVEIDSNLRDASVERLKASLPGTRVVLNLKKQEGAVTNEIRDYLRTTFLFPTIPVMFVDYDSLNKVAKSVVIADPDFSPPDFEQLWVSFVAGETSTDELLGIVKQFSLTAEKKLAFANQQIAEGERSYPGVHRFDVYVARESFFVRGNGPIPTPTQSSPVGVFFSESGTPIRAVALHTKNEFCRGAFRLATITIPFVYDSPDIGIEWHSLHSFLVVDDEIKKMAHYDFHTSEERVFFSNFILGTDTSLSRTEILAAVEEYLEDQGYEVKDFFQSSGRRARKIADLGIYHECMLTHYDDIKTGLMVDFRRDRPWESLFSVAQATAKRNKNIILPIAEWYDRRSAAIAQDGIKLPLTVHEIAPVGATKGHANFTANARFALNVSRNAIDQTPNSVQLWKERIGFPLLSALASTIHDALRNCGIKYSWSDLWMRNEENQIMQISDWNDVKPVMS